MAKAQAKTRLEAARAKMYQDLVFECAERVFAQRGYEAATMQEIAAEAGISLRTLYASAAGKKEVYGRIHAERAAEFLNGMTAELMGSGSPAQNLAHGVRAYVDFVIARPHYFALLVREGRLSTMDPASEGDARWQQGLKMFSDLLEAGMAAGQFYRGNAELMANTAMTLMQVQMVGLLRSSPEIGAAEASEQILLQMRRLLSTDSNALQVGGTVSA